MQSQKYGDRTILNYRRVFRKFIDYCNGVYLLATEGKILSKVYNNKLDEKGIVCETPREDEFGKLRLCIEAVKTNSYDNIIKETFIDFLDRSDSCILGCTELPILYDKYKDEISLKLKDKLIIDPLYLALNKAHEIYSQW